MFQKLDHKLLGKLTPLAEIDVTCRQLRDRGIEFTEDTDDWGKHKIAALAISGVPGAGLALVCYDIRPKMTDLFISGDPPSNDDEIGRVVWLVATAINLPAAIFHWRSRSGEMVTVPSIPLSAGSGAR
jgi:hypothetical protein